MLTSGQIISKWCLHDGSEFKGGCYEKYLFSSRKCSQVDSAIVRRGDWLGKPENIKVEINGAVVYVGSPDRAQSFVFWSRIVTE